MPKGTRSRTLARNSTPAEAAKRCRCQEDDQQRDIRLSGDRQAHSLARNEQPTTSTALRKEDYTSIALEYDPETS